MTFRNASRIAFALALLLAAPVAAQQTDVIRGQVTGPDNRPIDGVQVTATSVAGGVNRTARTNNDGRFTITFPGGDGDYIVSFRRRMDIARQHHADLFVSIHADAFTNWRARGASVYVLSERGATSEAARWLAARENAADLIGGVSLDDKDDLLASVLLDLSQTATLSASLQAGAHVLRELERIGPLHRRDVQQAGFLVLKSPDIPSLLIETAYISNPEEERRLADRREQARLASSILAGIRRYFLENPPPGTRLAKRIADEPLRYDVLAGDTLSGIADRFQVSIVALRDANALSDDRIHTGQVLAIPLAPR